MSLSINISTLHEEFDHTPNLSKSPEYSLLEDDSEQEDQYQPTSPTYSPNSPSYTPQTSANQDYTSKYTNKPSNTYQFPLNSDEEEIEDPCKYKCNNFYPGFEDLYVHEKYCKLAPRRSTRSKNRYNPY